MRLDPPLAARLPSVCSSAPGSVSHTLFYTRPSLSLVLVSHQAPAAGLSLTACTKNSTQININSRKYITVKV